METFFKIIGIEKLGKRLLELAPEIRNKYAVRALRAGGKIVQAAAKAEAPVLARPKYRRGVLIRKPGTMRAAIKVRLSKDTKRSGDVGVFVNVKPAKGANIGKWSPTDPWYWKFVHFSTKTNKHPVPFLTNTGKILDTKALKAIEDDLIKTLPKLNQP